MNNLHKLRVMFLSTVIMMWICTSNHSALWDGFTIHASTLTAVIVVMKCATNYILYLFPDWIIYTCIILVSYLASVCKKMEH